MGVQIFNKDVSVVSSIKGIAKANINNITGVGGWSGGGGPGTQGPNNPGSVTDAGYGDFSWNNINDALTNNEQYASCTCPNATLGSSTNVLQFQNFGFSIPTNATIDGIEVKLKTYCDNLQTLFPIAVSLMLGTFPNTNYGSKDMTMLTLEATPTIYTLGGPTFKWNDFGPNWAGQSMTPSIVNNPTFSFIVEQFLFNDADTVYINNITMKIYYTV